MDSIGSTAIHSLSTMNKLASVLHQISGESAKPIEDLKIDRFLDQLKIQLCQSGYLKKLLHDDAGLVQFFSTFCTNMKGQTWVMTFALKLWSTLLSCPDSHTLLTHSTESTCTVPSYVPTSGGQDEVKGHMVHGYLLDFLTTARNPVFWEEASVRNAWLVTVKELLSIDEHQVLVQDLMNKTDAINVAFSSLIDPSLFVVSSAQDLISSLLHKLCHCVIQKQVPVNTIDVIGSEHTPAKVMKLDTPLSQKTGLASSHQLDGLLQRLTEALQTSSQPPTQIQSRLNQSLNPAAKTNQLKLATIGIVKRVWRSGDNSNLKLLDEKLSCIPWCLKTLQEDGEHTKDVRLAVVESLPVVFSKWPWSSDSAEVSQNSQGVKVLSELFQLPVQVLRWQGIQYSLQLARALYSVQYRMRSHVPVDAMKQIECNPPLVQLLSAPLTAILQSPDGTTRPRRKLLGFVNPHMDSATCLADAHDEVSLQVLEGQVSAVKLVCLCIDGLYDVLDKMPLLSLIKDANLLTKLSSLLAICWPGDDAHQKDSSSVCHKLRGSSKVTKATLNLLAAILDKMLNGASDYDNLRQYGIHDILKGFTDSLTNVLAVSINDQALMCKTLDVLTKLLQINAAIDANDSLLGSPVLDCVQNLASDTCCWEIRDSALGVLIAVIHFGNDSDLTEAKTRRFPQLIWDCVGDHEGFVQASGIAALPLVYKRSEFWQDMLQQCQITEVAVVSDIIHYLRLSGSPFVRSAAIATLTSWLTDHKLIQSSVLQACAEKPDHGASQPKMPSDVDHMENPRKPAPKDIPGVVSGYFQDILEAEAESSSVIHSVSNEKERETDTNATKPSCGLDNTAICTLPSQYIGHQILTTMYQVSNSSDVETSIKTLHFWTSLFQLHVPQGAFCLQVNEKDQTNLKQAQRLQELFDSGKLTQDLFLSTISKPSHGDLESLKRCLDNTRCLRLLLGMLGDSKMAAVKACFILQILQGFFHAGGISTDKNGGAGQSQDIAKDHIGTTDFGDKLDDANHEVSSQPDNSGDGICKDKDIPIALKSTLSSGGHSVKDTTDLCQVVGIIKTGALFEDVFANFLHLDFLLIRQIIVAREMDTLDSVLDDLIEPSEEWGLPGDINVDCY